MRAYMAFNKKEWTENLRTYRFFIMGIVFLLFGMMNPIVAKYTPALIEAIAPEMGLHLPEPTMLDSWVQFFKNIGQMGLLILVIVFGGTMANELNRGTLINMLTKGLKRSTVILSKFTMATILWTICYALNLAVTYVYTAYFWDINGMHHAFLAFFSLWFFGVLLISLVILGGVFFKNTYGSLLFTGGAVVMMTLLNISPKLHKYNPITLSFDNMSLLTAQKAAADFLPALVICAALVVLLIVLSVVTFNKKQL